MATVIFGYSLPDPIVYFALEDGTVIGHETDIKNGYYLGYYREPGESGYDVDDAEMEKYFKLCVNSVTGEPQNCTMEPGAPYIQCVNDCALEECPDADSQKDCSTLTEEEKSSCESKQKWCKNYTIENATENMGFVPLTYHCRGKHGLFTQEMGTVVVDSSGNLGNCYFEDGNTLVNRSLAGDYAYCNGDVCQDTFAGGYWSGDFDARYRLWYSTFRRRNFKSRIGRHHTFSMMNSLLSSHTRTQSTLKSKEKTCLLVSWPLTTNVSYLVRYLYLFLYTILILLDLKLEAFPSFLWIPIVTRTRPW